MTTFWKLLGAEFKSTWHHFGQLGPKGDPSGLILTPKWLLIGRWVLLIGGVIDRWLWICGVIDRWVIDRWGVIDRWCY